jgi:DNA-binding beta-propeller fold protein YncE
MMEKSPWFDSPTRLRALLGWAALLGIGLVLLLVAGRPIAVESGPLLSPAGEAAGAPLSGPPAAGIERHHVVATIPLAPGIGGHPSAIAADPHSPFVYIANEGSQDITVLSGTEALGMVAAVHEGGYYGVWMDIGVHPTNGLLYAVEQTGARCLGPANEFYLQVITATEVITTVSLGGCNTLRGGCGVRAMAFQPTTGLLYLLRTYAFDTFPPWGTITVLSGTEELGMVEVDGFLPGHVAVDPVQGWVYVTADYTNVLVLSGTVVVGTAPVTEAGAIALQPRTGLAYVQSGIEALALVQGTSCLGQVDVGLIAELAADPARGYVYVSHPSTPTLTVVSGTVVLTDVVIPAPGGRMAVDAATGLVYLRHPGTSQLTVLSGTAVLTTVEVLSGSAPLASSPFTGLVYAVDGERSVAVLSGTQRLDAIPPAAPQPRALAADPTTGRMVALFDPPALSWIQDETIVATVPLTAAPTQMLLHPASGLVYLALQDEQQVWVMSGTGALGTIPLAGPPQQMAVNPQGGPVYVGDSAGVLTVISGTESIAALPLGLYTLAGVAVHPGSGFVYATDPWADRVHVLSGTAVVTEVVVEGFPRDIVADPGSGYVYVETGAERLWLISGTQVVSSVDVVGPWDILTMQAAPAGGSLYVHEREPLYRQCDRIVVYEGTQEVAVWTLPGGTRYTGLALHPSLGHVYAGHGVYGSLLSIGAGARVAEAVVVGDGSWVRGVAVLPTGRVYAATDHAIAILEPEAGYRFYLQLLIKAARR